MFCYQCEQTYGGRGCDKLGVCGKLPASADLQDLIIHELKKLATAVRDRKPFPAEAGTLLLDGLFTTVTNVNFDDADLIAMARRIDAARAKLDDTAPELGADDGAVAEKAAGVSMAKLKEKEDGDIFALKSLVLFGLKGMAAYAHHAKVLGVEDEGVYRFIAEALDGIARGGDSVDGLLALALKTGEVNFKVMEMLDRANTSRYGNPEPTRIRVTAIKGKAILVSGHDLKDLEEILKQTEGKGVNVYTHGEMLPCLAYPGLKKYRHLVGNWGGAWQNQQKEFPQFPGAIIMTTNCIQNPKGYDDRIFTSGLVGWPEVVHIKDCDFTPAIEKALEMPGFTEDEEEKYIMTGFAHDAVLKAADKVIGLVKSGKIRRFFLIGGCDGAKPGRNYFTDFALSVPKDCVILTLACGKYRFNKLEFGDIDGLPRLLDMGQCNDAYSAVKVALALSEAFGVPVNDLPLSIILSWYEQKAVCVLLSLLHLGIRNIRLGPSLPAFFTPNVAKVLEDKFGTRLTTTVEQDLKEALG